MGMLRNMLGGAATIFNIWPPPMDHSKWPTLRHRSVEEALASDWQRVGDSMRKAMDWGDEQVASHVAEQQGKTDSHL